MSRQPPLDWLRTAGIQHRDKGTGEIWFDCCWCKQGHKDGSCSMSDETGVWNCARATCSGPKRGTIFDLRVARGELEIHHKGAGDHVGPAVQKQYRRPTMPDPYEGPAKAEAKEILLARGISREILWRAGVNILQYGPSPAIAFPYHSHGNLVNIKYRLKAGPKPGWKNFAQEKQAQPTLYLRDLVPMPAERLLITEGEFDCLAAQQMGCEFAVSMPAGINNLEWIETEWQWLEPFREIYLAVDMDVPQDQVAKLAARLGTHRCRRVSMPYKDMNDCLLLGGWTADDLNMALERSAILKPADICLANELNDEFMAMHFTTDLKRNGKPTRLDGLDWFVKGWRLGCLNIWQGADNSGKTTLLAQVIGEQLMAGVPCFFCSLEMPNWRVMEWMAQQILKTDAYTPEEYSGLMKKIGNNLILYRGAAPQPHKELGPMIEYCCRRYGVEHVAIDNLAHLGIRKDDFAGQAEFIRVAKHQWAAQYSCTLHLVAHSRKGSEGLGGRKRDRTDIQGAGEISFLADNVFIVERNESDAEEKAYDMLLHIDKNRYIGPQGVLKYRFEKDERRFYLLPKEHVKEKIIKPYEERRDIDG